MASVLSDAYGFSILSSAQDTGALQTSWLAMRKSDSAWKSVDQQLVGGAGPVGARRLAALKPLVRRGVPIDLRPSQWHSMSGAAARQAAAGPGYYARLATVNALPVNALLTINEELSPGVFAFRTHALFKKQDGMDAVRRLLAAYVQHNPAGFFRGLGHIAGFLLVVMGPAAEEEAFWVLATLLQDKLLPYCDGQAAFGLKVELRVLDQLAAKKLPKVAAHLARIDTTASTLAQGWFSNLFTTTLPAEVAARVFDCLMLEGSKVLLRVALALMKQYETTICAASSPSQLRKVLDTRAARLYAADALMAGAFKGTGAMPTAAINQLRAEAAAAVEAQMAEQRQRLEAIICRMH